MRSRSRNVFLVMHNWAGYLAGVQLGIADYVAQRPDWILNRILPTTLARVLRHAAAPDGVIAYVEPTHVRPLKALRVPVVDVGDWADRKDFVRALPSNAPIGRLAAEYLIDLGLRNFAARGQDAAAFSGARIEAFCRRLASSGFGADVFGTTRERLSTSISTPPGIDRALAAWLLRLPKPVGVFAVTDQRGADVLNHCRHLDLRVPEEVCVIGVDNDELINRFTHPQLSSIALPTQKLGFEAARLLDAMMAGEPRPTRNLLFAPVGVVTRQSTDVLMIPDEDVHAAARYIRAHASRRMSVRDVLKTVPVNRRSLERKFRKLLGRTPLEEIQRVRFERARHLLGATDLPISAVATESGYRSSWRLARVFHAALNMTPTAYRRSLRTDAALST